MAGRRGCRLSSLCLGHLSLGCGDAAGSWQPRQLVALACRRSVLSRFSDDLAPAAFAFCKAILYGSRMAIDLDRCWPIDSQHSIGRSAVSVASRRDQRMATLIDSEPGLGHHIRQRDPLVLAPPLYFAYPSVSYWPRYLLSRQYGAVSGRIQQRARQPMVEIRLVGLDGDRMADCFRSYLDFQPGFSSAKIATSFARGLIAFVRASYAPAFSSAAFMPAQLMRVEASGVPAPRQWVSRLTA